jgi:hypothetical protein
MLVYFIGENTEPVVEDEDEEKNNEGDDAELNTRADLSALSEWHADGGHHCAHNSPVHGGSCV